MTESPDVIIGEVLPDEKADGKKKQLVPRKSDNVAFGSFITKSNDLIQRTKYSLPRNEQKILFMMSTGLRPSTIIFAQSIQS